MDVSKNESLLRGRQHRPTVYMEMLSPRDRS